MQMLYRLSYVGVTSTSGKRDSNPRPSAWKADALPLSYSRVEKRWWGGKDSNLRRRTPTDLQSVPFSHSGTSPPTRNSLSTGPIGACSPFRARPSRSFTSRLSPFRRPSGPVPAVLPAVRPPAVWGPESPGSAERPEGPDCTRSVNSIGSNSNRSELDRSGLSWRRDLNPRPADYKSAALPLSYASKTRSKDLCGSSALAGRSKA